MGGPTQLRFSNRAIALAAWNPIFSASEFASGPIVLANEALSAGGVERQVVNTLCGLEQRNRVAGLLCLRLHEDPELDFFVPALRGFNGFVRNVITPGRALATLWSTIPTVDYARMRAAITWMPPDVQIDVLRFAAEFAILKPSIVHAWQDATNIAAAYGAWLVGVPRILVSCRNVAPANFPYFRTYMLYGYREIASCASISMINNSESGARDYAEWLGVPTDRFVVIRNGIDANMISRPATHDTAALRARLGISAGSKIVGSIFRFNAEKRPLLWIETAARICERRADCHFVVFGEGPLKAEARAAARRYGFADRLHLLGNIQESQLGMSLFDVFLLTSQFEGTPNVILEGSLLGIPVVATNAGGTRECIAEGKTGRVLNTTDPNELAQHVIAILENPVWSKRVLDYGPAFVQQHFGLARALDETLALYRC